MARRKFLWTPKGSSPGEASKSQSIWVNPHTYRILIRRTRRSRRPVRRRICLIRLSSLEIRNMSTPAGILLVIRYRSPKLRFINFYRKIKMWDKVRIKMRVFMSSSFKRSQVKEMVPGWALVSRAKKAPRKGVTPSNLPWMTFRRTLLHQNQRKWKRRKKSKNKNHRAQTLIQWSAKLILTRM